MPAGRLPVPAAPPVPTRPSRRRVKKKVVEEDPFVTDEEGSSPMDAEDEGEDSGRYWKPVRRNYLGGHLCKPRKF